MSPTRTATGPHVLRQINAAAVLDALRADPRTAIRVAALMAVTGLSRPAVMRAVSLLVDRGLAEYVDADPGEAPQLGRPAQLVRFRSGQGFVAGIDVGPHKVLAMVADLAGEVRAELRTDLPEGATGPRVLDAVRATLRAVVRTAGISPGQLWAVCVGSPGVVDRERGEVLVAPSIPGWAGLDVVPRLRMSLTCPVAIENDVNLAVRAEQWQGAATDTDTLVFVQWGERIGTGIVLGGQPHRGAHAAAGELGFTDLTGDPDQPAAPVDTQMGPFERLVGASAIRDLATAAYQRTGSGGWPGDNRDVAALVGAAAGGDPTANEVVELVAARFAKGLANLLLILDPGVVIVGGGISRAGETLLGPVRRHLRQRLLTPVDLRLSELGERAVALGAVRHALDEVETRLSPAAS